MDNSHCQGSPVRGGMHITYNSIKKMSDSTSRMTVYEEYSYSINYII